MRLLPLNLLFPLRFFHNIQARSHENEQFRDVREGGEENLHTVLRSI